MSGKFFDSSTEVNNLKQMLERSADLFGDKNAFWLKSKSGKYYGVKYSEFKNDVDSLGTALINLGLKNKHIALISENRYEWCLTYLAAANGTGVIVPLDRELPAAEICNLIKRSKASALVFSEKLYSKIHDIIDELSEVEFLINMDAAEDTEEYLSLSKLIAEGNKLLNSGNRDFIDAEIDPDVMSFLIFTSGTTDLAKGVMLSHRNIAFDVISVSEAVKMYSSDSILSILPLHHTYECTAGFLTMVYNGCSISFCEGLKYITKNLQEVKPTLLISVPLILENVHKKIWDQAKKRKSLYFKLKVGLSVSNFLLNNFKVDVRKKLFKQIQQNLGGRLRIVISGAAGLNPEVGKCLNDLGIPIYQGYGLTECSPIVSVNREDNLKHNSIGLPLNGVQIRIDNPNEEGIGELVVKGPNVMLGYYENEAATASVLKNGWLYTGDLGYLDVDGFYYITGRKKNVIVTKNGKNIFPEEVESYLNKSPYILESLVSGENNKDSDETLVIAQIVPNFEAIKQKLNVDILSNDDVYKIISAEVKSVNKSMPLYKHIKKFTIRETEFVKTTTKKIKRYAQNIS